MHMILLLSLTHSLYAIVRQYIILQISKLLNHFGNYSAWKCEEYKIYIENEVRGKSKGG